MVSWDGMHHHLDPVKPQALRRYLDAPGAVMACLRGTQRHAHLPTVTMVFCAVEHAEEMKVSPYLNS